MKIFLCVSYLFLSTVSLFSLGEGSGISIGFLGVGVDVTEKDVNGYFHGRLLNFIYETEYGVGLNVSPFLFSLNINNTSDSLLTFINTSLFYDYLKDYKYLLSGPFVSIHAISPYDPLFFELCSGLMLLWRSPGGYYSDNSIFDGDMIFVELGYKYNKNDKNGFYVQAGLDLITVFFLLGGLGKEKALDDYQRDRFPNY